MDNQTFQRIKDLITQHQVVGVVVKPNPSLDEMAAGLGMYLVLAGMGKAASIATPTDPTVGLSNLVGIQKVGKSLSAGAAGKGGNLTVSFPYKDGEIEKVSYTQEDGFLNILVQAGQNGLSFSQNDVKFTQSGSNVSGAMPTLLFTIGVASLSEISSVVNSTDLQNMTVVNIDNKPNNGKYGDVVVVSPRFSSVSEQVADFLTLLEPQIELDKDTSQNLFDGISFATKDYTAPNTSYLAFEMAGILMKKGATRYKAPGAQAPSGQNVSQYFPPIQNNPLQSLSNAQGQQPTVQTQPVQQPQFAQPATQAVPTQPMQSFNSVQEPVQPMNQPFAPINQQFQPMQAPVQPAEQPVQSPVQPQVQQPIQNPVQQQPDQAPADWLTPKVYKGSSVL